MISSLPRTVRIAFLAALAAAGVAPTVFAQDSRDDEIKLLREQIRQLDQKLRVLERKQELKDEAAAAAPAPKITASDGRVEVASTDGATSLRLRGLVQADARLYLDDANAAQDGLLLRRARLIFEGKFAGLYSYVIQPEFAGTVQILDAYVNATFTPALQVRLGRFKTPVGLEQLQSDPVAFFNERSVATNLTPNRDVGIQLQGDLLENRLNYTVGAFNGQLDGGNSPTTNLNAEGDFTLAARVFATPFINDKSSPLSGLGVGVGVSTGNYRVGAPGIAYRTDGQQTFFGYRAATLTNGNATTISPQAYYYHGQLGVLAEYVSSSIHLVNGTNAREVTNEAFNFSVGYVLTGEDSTYRGVTPKTVFAPAKGTWGAFEVVGRVAQVDVDNDVFLGTGTTSLADPATNATKINSYGLGLNWYLSRSIRANFDAFKNEFDFTAARPTTGALSDDELSFISRFQVSF